MNVYRIYHLLIDLSFIPYWSLCLWQKGGEKFVCLCFYFNPFVDDWQKGGEEFISNKSQIFVLFNIYACFPSFIHKGGVVFVFMHICFVLQMYGHKNLMSFMIVWHVIFAYMSYICIHTYELHCHILLFFVMHELRGSFFEALL